MSALPPKAAIIETSGKAMTINLMTVMDTHDYGLYQGFCLRQS